MKILRIIADSDPRSGGPIEGTRRFGAVWAQHGHQQDLLTLDAPGESFLTDYPGEIIGVGPPRTSNPLHKYRYAPKMVPWLRSNLKKYDAVIVSGLWRYSAMGARQALIKSGVPYYVFTHGMLDPWFRETYPVKHWIKQISWLISEGPLLNSARNVLFTSREEMLLAENAFWPYSVKGRIVNYGTHDLLGDPLIQENAFRAKIAGLGQRDYFLFMSRLHPKKGCDLLVKAFGSIAARYPGIDIVIAGPDEAGLTENLISQAEAAGIGARVHFAGMLRGDDKAGALHGAKAFVLPSHQENFGIVVAEAMACSTPVLISNKVNIWREIEESQSGFVAPDDIAGTTALLESFLKLNQLEASVMGQRGRTYFLEHFHVEKAAMDLLGVLAS
ncbi:glycosyltransferase [Sphingomonas sp. H39-1-10]|uniref:glycosyltransferase n=1 Tax=Sphingomonas pollutisoli TaxID=3030829 RepID=UPI0023B95FC1|nr:glycosyltransferase [Sphingomonas pollutisoli]MDF0490994.1 glycosyltransferase [Sphingomonas pollutisoli]